MIPRHSSEAYVCSMEDSAVPTDRSPKYTYLGCSQPATYGVERAYMSPMVYCLEHMRPSPAARVRRGPCAGSSS